MRFLKFSISARARSRVSSASVLTVQVGQISSRNCSSSVFSGACAVSARFSSVAPFCSFSWIWGSRVSWSASSLMIYSATRRLRDASANTLYRTEPVFGNTYLASASQQQTSRAPSGPADSMTGGVLKQRSCASGQRGRKGHPCGRSPGEGTVPGMASSFAEGGVSSVGAERIRPQV